MVMERLVEVVGPTFTVKVARWWRALQRWIKRLAQKAVVEYTGRRAVMPDALLAAATKASRGLAVSL